MARLNTAGGHRRPAPLCVGAALLVAGLLAVPTGVSAQVKVEGEPDAVRVEVDNASIEEVLRYRTSVALDRPVTGVYTGTRQQVLTRLLDGHDFVIKTVAGNLEVVVLGANAAGAAAAPVATRPTRAMAPPLQNPAAASVPPILAPPPPPAPNQAAASVPSILAPPPPPAPDAGPKANSAAAEEALEMLRRALRP